MSTLGWAVLITIQWVLCFYMGLRAGQDNPNWRLRTLVLKWLVRGHRGADARAARTTTEPNIPDEGGDLDDEIEDYDHGWGLHSDSDSGSR